MIFETIMLVCFGVAWPFSIYKSWKTREIGSKSFVFLLALLLGYIAGILHKIFYDPDAVVYLYAINGLMVACDMGLYLRNRLYHIKRSTEQALETEQRSTGQGPTGQRSTGQRFVGRRSAGQGLAEGPARPARDEQATPRAERRSGTARAHGGERRTPPVRSQGPGGAGHGEGDDR